LIKNNLIAIAIHIVLSCVSIGAMFSLWAIAENHRFNFQLLQNIIFIMVILFLYFLCGRLFLHNTHDVTKNILSVTALTIIIIVATLIARWGFQIFAWVNPPFIPIMMYLTEGRQTSSLTHTIVIFAVTVLPSLAMWGGMLIKQK